MKARKQARQIVQKLSERYVQDIVAEKLGISQSVVCRLLQGEVRLHQSTIDTILRNKDVK
jgi:predicted transcriptional regulator